MWKKKKQTTPKPMQVGIILFVVWMAFVGYRGEERAKQGDPSAVSIKRYEVIQQFGDIDRWRKIANPSFNRTINFEDKQAGTRDIAACGQQVKLKVSYVPQEGQVIDPSLTPTEPVTFTIGDKQVVEAWDRGVRGMRLGGIRRIVAGSRLVDINNQDIEAKPFIFDLELLELKPNLPADSVPTTHKIIGEGSKDLGGGTSCGEPIAVTLKMWKKDKTLLLERNTSEPLRLTLGKNEAGQGLDRGLVGMYPGETRRLTIPPVYQSENGLIAFPKGEIAVVEVTRVPYNETVPDETVPTPATKEEPEKEKEQDREPDSQPPERDQTLPDDGGDSQGGGT